MTLLLALLACGGSTPSDPPAERRARGKAKAKAADPLAKIPGRFKTITDAPDEDLEALAALGYLDGTRPPPNEAGVRIDNADAIAPGLNLYVSGQGPEAHLIDVNGTVLHKWAFDWFDAFESKNRRRGKEFPNHWRRAHLYEDGGLIGIWGGQGLVRLDKDSTFLWGVSDENIHHDVDVASDGAVWTLSREPMSIPQLAKRKVVMDTILVYEPDGTRRSKFSVMDCFLDSDFASKVSTFQKRGDVLHTNTISILDDRYSKPEFAAGNLLVSFRATDMLAVIDPKARKVVWLLEGNWDAQHQPVLLDDDTVLLFDNRGLGERSRVLEANTTTGAITWQYGKGEGEYFWSRILGSVQRLPNGNTLVSESDNGRAFEVTRGGERVWEFTNPHRAGDQDQYIASLYELVRLPADFDTSWADPTTAKKSVKTTMRQ